MRESTKKKNGRGKGKSSKKSSEIGKKILRVHHKQSSKKKRNLAWNCLERKQRKGKDREKKQQVRSQDQ